MIADIEKLHNIAHKKTKTIIGLMSGTSCDGLDIALCEITGCGTDTKIKVKHFITTNFDSQYKKLIHSVFSKKNIDLEQLTLINPYIGKLHASLINIALKKWNISPTEIDCIASHGQTIYHAPKSLHKNIFFGNATLQIGDADHMAIDTGIITLSDFRQKHIAAGGEGAPLAVYGDYLIFGKKDENRIMLNIGGIANFTYLPGNMDTSKVFSTDVGPGNTIMDALAHEYNNDLYFDEEAKIALKGICNKNLLSALKDNFYFNEGFPKTTGPELFNLNYLNSAKEKSNTNSLSVEDLMCTLNHFSSWCIVDAIKKTITDKCKVFVSGGGMHNPLLMQNIKNALPNFYITTTSEIDINPDAKEAVLFAILANECLSGKKSSFGNKEKGIPEISMGKISLPN